MTIVTIGLYTLDSLDIQITCHRQQYTCGDSCGWILEILQHKCKYVLWIHSHALILIECSDMVCILLTTHPAMGYDITITNSHQLMEGHQIWKVLVSHRCNQHIKTLRWWMMMAYWLLCPYGLLFHLERGALLYRWLLKLTSLVQSLGRYTKQAMLHCLTQEQQVILPRSSPTSH